MAGFAEVEPVKNEKGCWYLTTIYYCPLCGRDETHRTRQPGPAPDPLDWQARMDYNEVWDYCDAL